jgi:hypothetical protein
MLLPAAMSADSASLLVARPPHGGALRVPRMVVGRMTSA